MNQNKNLKSLKSPPSCEVNFVREEQSVPVSSLRNAYKSLKLLQISTTPPPPPPPHRIISSKTALTPLKNSIPVSSAKSRDNFFFSSHKSPKTLSAKYSSSKKAEYLLKRYHTDACFRKAMCSRVKAYYHRPEVRKAKLAYQKAYSQRPEVKAQRVQYQSQYQAQYHQDRYQTDKAFREAKRKQNQHYYYTKIMYQELERLVKKS